MTLASAIRDNKAVYTLAGAGDFAVEKLREVPGQVTKARATVAKYQDDARGNVDGYRSQVRGTVDRYRVEVRKNVDRYRGEARDNVSKLQDKIEVKDLPGAVVAYTTHFGTRAFEFVDELAERGKKVVHRTAAEVAESAEGVAAVSAGDAAKPASKAKAATAKKTARQQVKSPASTTGTTRKSGS
ncbi:hypothetical protein [Actinomadura parmotrematis]|uniref:Heparin-binding hemagglutinin n=1 Tax=Actinomadura parmotrematis TaxID=2864039 RepID=A0ABS7FYX3_9ACTN|nr:hypothetical protein [Actinomadura parmotrematis]MBW8485350.1 hypothetical protein [Actinomadura parmotrematis]